MQRLALEDDLLHLLASLLLEILCHVHEGKTSSVPSSARSRRHRPWSTLEHLIMAHPQILEDAVIAVPHPTWVERPLACKVVHTVLQEATQDPFPLQWREAARAPAVLPPGRLPPLRG